MKWKFKFKTKCIIWKNPWNYKYQLFTILVDYTEGDLLREVVDYGRWLVTGGGWLREAVHYGRSMVMGGGLLRELVEGGGWLHRRWLVTGGGWLREINGYGRRLITGGGWLREMVEGGGWLLEVVDYILEVVDYGRWYLKNSKILACTPLNTLRQCKAVFTTPIFKDLMFLSYTLQLRMKSKYILTWVISIVISSLHYCFPCMMISYFVGWIVMLVLCCAGADVVLVLCWSCADVDLVLCLCCASAVRY